MVVHLIKLCVGTESIEDLRHWQEGKLASLRRRGQPPRLRHWTRMTPKRRVELLAGGSLYWVIKGQIRVRQRLLGLEAEADEEGRPRCGLLLDPELVPTRLRACRPFQGWRYLEARDAPPDLGTAGIGERAGTDDEEPSAKMVAELRWLGLV